MLEVPTVLAELTANYVRTYALSQFPHWRPFAYRFESKASMMAADMFVDKPLDIHTRMSGLDFGGQDGEIGQVIEETYVINKTLDADGVRSQSKLSVGGGRDLVARAVGETRLTVFYLFERGVVPEEKNRERLAHRADVNTVVFASRHTDISSISFKVRELDDTTSVLEFGGCDEKVIRESIAGISRIFSK